MRYHSITRNGDFARTYHRGKSYVSPFLVTYVLPRKNGGVRLGITTSKKIGGAVQRVRARRVIREAYYAAGVDKTRNVDIVFVARTATTKVKMQKVAQAMHAHLAAAGLLVP